MLITQDIESQFTHWIVKWKASRAYLEQTKMHFGTNSKRKNEASNKNIPIVGDKPNKIGP